MLQDVRSRPWYRILFSSGSIWSYCIYVSISSRRYKLFNLPKLQNYTSLQTCLTNPKTYSCLLSSHSEKAMAPHSSILAWKIPWTEEPGGLQSMGSLRVRHDWATSLSRFTFMHWRRKWQPAPVFLPGESQGRGSLVGCRPWGRTESDTTEVT